MNKESILNLNAGDYAISHCDSDKTYTGLEVHKMLCDAYIAGNNNERLRKAEGKGYEAYPVSFYEGITVDVNEMPKDVFVKGYQQAEKDLQLTWEDIRELYIVFAEVDAEIELCMVDIKSETIGYYQEVLKRFKTQKGE